MNTRASEHRESDLETSDREVLEAFLRRTPIWSGYALGDLDEPHFERSRWFLEGEALALRYALGETVTLMTFGDAREVAALVPRVPLPAHFEAHLPAEHAAALRELRPGFDLSALVPYLRYGLQAPDLRVPPAPPQVRAAALRGQDLDAARALYAHYPNNWFSPARVEEGCYLGLWRDGELVAAAGTHVASRAYRVAALGDVVVATKERGQGLGSHVSALLCQRLLGFADWVVLNVAAENTAARRAYQRVGFRDPVRHFEGQGVWLT